MGLLAYQATKAKEASEAEFQRVLAQKASIEKKIATFGDPASLDKEAKERFNITAPGEKVLIIVDREALLATSTPQAPFYEQVWQAVINFFR